MQTNDSVYFVSNGQIENEEHFLLDCYLLEVLRRNLFREVYNRTGGTYQLGMMRIHERIELVKTLIGNAVRIPGDRMVIHKAASVFISKALKFRRKLLSRSEADSD